MRLVLDTNMLRRLCHTRAHDDARMWLQKWIGLRQGGFAVDITISAAAAYELRRSYLWKLDTHPWIPQAMQRLDQVCRLLEIEPVTNSVLRRAAQLWADARRGGYKTAPDHHIDWDVIIASQALELDAIVVTSNARHFTCYGADARDWPDIAVPSN